MVAALNNAKKVGAFLRRKFFLIADFFKFLFADFGPFDGTVDCFFGFVVGSINIGKVVEDDDHVGFEVHLDFDRILRREEGIFETGKFKADARVGNSVFLAGLFGQGHDLKTAGIGDDSPIPGHKFSNTTEGFDSRSAGGKR